MDYYIKLELSFLASENIVFPTNVNARVVLVGGGGGGGASNCCGTAEGDSICVDVINTVLTILL